MRLPQIDEKIDIERVKGLADTFIKEGFTYFDTAACYHKKQSEGAFREAVAKRYPREAYTITDKLSLFMIEKSEDMPSFFDNQIKELGVDYMDIYLMHSLDPASYKKAVEWDAFNFMREKLKEGRVKHIGFSFHGDAELLEKILTEQPDMEYVQLQINYIDWEDAKVQSRKCCETAVKHGKKVIVMEPVKGGSLVRISDNVKAHLNAANPEMSVASWAIRFAATHENVVMVLSGMSNEEQVADNISYMKDFKPLDASEMATVMAAADMIREEKIIPCTTCRYCIDYCPQSIAIPDYFMYYNIQARFGAIPFRDKRAMHELMEKCGKPSDCIKCGACEEICPQNIEIRKMLEEITALEPR